MTGSVGEWMSSSRRSESSADRAIEADFAIDISRATHVNSATMGDSIKVKAAKRRLERAAIAWAESSSYHSGSMMSELQAAARGLRDAVAAQGKPA